MQRILVSLFLGVLVVKISAGRGLIYTLEGMRPFKLHMKTTLLVAGTIVVILAGVAYYQNRTTTDAELEHLKVEAGWNAYHFAVLFADRMAEFQPLITSESDARLMAERIYRYGSNVDDSRWPTGNILDIEIYSFATADGVRRPIVGSYPSGEAKLLSAEDIAELVQGQSHVSEGPVLNSKRTVDAAAPIVFAQTRQVVGVVAVRAVVPKPQLAGKLNRITLLAIVLAVAFVSFATYHLFKRLVYKPLDRLLVAMARVEKGDLSVKVPTRNEDELGRLTESFNQMVERLRDLADERANYARHLETRVSEATSELGERNEQLNVANIELFEMQRQIGQLERLATAGQLAAQFAHEVGTPLNLISGHVQLLNRETDERTRKRLEIISAQITRIEGIVRGMLDQTRRPSVQLAPVDVSALLNRIFDTIAPTLAARRVALEADIDPGLPPVAADSDQLQQVLINLVNNSLDAMPDGGGLVVRASRSEGEVKIELSDSGKGIAESDIPRIFEPLFTTKEQGKGAGFGLAVSKQIIAEHGGRITASSTPNEGSTFTIVLPIASQLLVPASTAEEEARA